jgi:hypothetical protein
VPTPIASPPDHLSARGTGIFDDQAMELPDWEDAEAAGWEPADWDTAESADWDPAQFADWEPESTEADPMGPVPGTRTRSDGGWFAAGGVADNLPPGPRLAGFMADARAIGLGRLTDDELIGVMRAARRLASWSAAMELAAAGDLWRRRWTEEQAGNPGAALHADDEIAAALTLTRRAADQVLSLAIALRRLPLTSQALTAGDIDLPRAMVIADEVTGLGNEHAAAVEQIVIAAAASQTTGQLRAATRRAVLSADPRAARKRKERALQDARVERWDENGGTAALAGRDLPPASVLAADQNLSALARQLKRAGAPGTLDQLRAQVYLALLTGSSVGSLIPAEPGAASASCRGDSSRGPAGLTGDSPGGTAPPRFCPPTRPSAFGGPGIPGISTSRRTPGTPGAFFASGAVNLTMSLASWLGLSDAPGDVAGFGGVSPSPTLKAVPSHTDAPAPDRHRVSTVLSGPPDHPVHGNPAPETDQQAAGATDRRTVHVTDREPARPAIPVDLIPAH